MLWLLYLVPFAAESNDKYFKEIFIDIGICCAQLEYTLNEIEAIVEINLVNKGGIAEQSAGQILRTVFPYYKLLSQPFYLMGQIHRLIDFIDMT